MVLQIAMVCLILSLIVSSPQPGTSTLEQYTCFRYVFAFYALLERIGRSKMFSLRRAKGRQTQESHSRMDFYPL